VTGWRFAAEGDRWDAVVPSAPTENSKRAFWQAAVPALAAHRRPRLRKPCIVVCRVSAPDVSGNASGGPLGRAKGLLDALHDDRKSGPWYRDRAAAAPLADDHPQHVRGLAVEVRADKPRTECQLGSAPDIQGDLLAAAPIELQHRMTSRGRSRSKRGSPSPEQSSLQRFERRSQFTAALPLTSLRRSSCGTGRSENEDNTWATWIAGRPLGAGGSRSAAGSLPRSQAWPTRSSLSAVVYEISG
jgi:hypothetical protein